MENQKINAEDNIDLVAVFQKIKSYWYLFVISIIFFASIAIIYLKFAEKRFSVSSTIMFDKIEAGSAPIDEIMEGDTYRKPENTLFVSNQITILKSNGLLEEVIDSLNHTVSYYTVERFWPGFLSESWMNEVYKNFPYTINVSKSAKQIIGVNFNIKHINENTVRIIGGADKVGLYDFERGMVVDQIENFSIDETVTVGQPFKSSFLNITVQRNSLNPLESFDDFDLYFKIKPDEALVKEWGNNFSIELTEKLTEDPREQPRVVNLIAESTVPRKGVEFMSALLEVYMKRNLERKNTKGEKAMDFLDEKISVVEDSLRIAEEKLESFKSSSSIVDVDATRSSIYGNLTELEKERSVVENQLSYYQSTLNNLNQLEDADKITAPSTYGINNEILNKLIEQYLQVSTRINELQYSVKEENPLLQQLRRQMYNLQDAIAQNLKSSINALNSQKGMISQRIGKINYDISSLPGDERRLARLDRNYEHFSQRYNFLVERKTEAQLALDSNTPDFEVIQDAKLADRPVWPNTNLIFSLAIVLGIIFPLGFVFFKEKTSDIVLGKDELERRTKAPLLGMIANGPNKVKIVSRTHPNSGIAESFKFARINLQYFHNDDKNKVIGITSSISGEGKTFCAANLAVAFAESGQKTLLICGDLRKPKIQEYFDLSRTGITDYLEKTARLEEVIQPTEINNLDLIAPGVLNSDPVNLFESEMTQELFDSVKDRYDRIVVETPPIGYVVDYFVLLKHFEINLFVVRYNFTKKNILDGINDLYNNHKIKNLYILFNDVKTSSNSYYGQVYGAKEYHGKVRKNNRLTTPKTKNPFS